MQACNSSRWNQALGLGGHVRVLYASTSSDLRTLRVYTSCSTRSSIAQALACQASILGLFNSPLHARQLAGLRTGQPPTYQATNNQEMVSERFRAPMACDAVTRGPRSSCWKHLVQACVGPTWFIHLRSHGSCAASDAQQDHRAIKAVWSQGCAAGYASGTRLRVVHAWRLLWGPEGLPRSGLGLGLGLPRSGCRSGCSATASMLALQSHVFTSSNYTIPGPSGASSGRRHGQSCP